MVHIRKKWVSALFRRWNLRVFGGKEGKNGKSVEKKTDARGGGWGSGGRNGAHCRAESVGVLCGKYSSTLRRVLEHFAESALRYSARRFSAFLSGKAGIVVQIFGLMYKFFSAFFCPGGLCHAFRPSSPFRWVGIRCDGLQIQ